MRSSPNGGTPAATSFSRRQALKSAGSGFGYLALAGMLGQAAPTSAAEEGPAPGPLAPRPPHYPAKARRINCPMTVTTT